MDIKTYSELALRTASGKDQLMHAINRDTVAEKAAMEAQ